ncbi:sigma-70 family RNA polymerase sigma factor [Rhizobium rosettiformans]|uniref:sigma-70 family RNA polymerase sigma factor n=1 Tax=Rhizobium rosettiformans TaxID=1368430 RepID=UPI0028559B76|nr:sigma-70 family RNA polymerase sigma factor [Rhizobium rosettiformans]MDR7030776.1 RNA polymerase sigma-70 factor (ECF subfamily) [Rhizobium rosettiformans]MDR7062603.1 RNA polymerase sigma-70 factor (ECF subfamily) [Rhizobium rosettiformans]
MPSPSSHGKKVDSIDHIKPISTMSERTSNQIAVFLEHRPALVKHAAQLLGSRDQAEDVVQDAFLRLKSVDANEYAPQQILSYLYSIVRNLALDQLKRRKVETRGRELDPPFWILPQNPGSPEESVLLADQARVASETLDALPPETRRAIELYRIEGWTLEAIASELNISIATTHRMIRSGMVKIALSLDHASH